MRGDQIVAVGTTRTSPRLAGPATRRIDLRGRSVIPGLIDNHMHLLRYGTTWKYEVRWDGVETRKEALEMLRARTQTVKPGDWIYILGGWAIEQFADDPKPFTREELDRVAPESPGVPAGVVLPRPTSIAARCSCSASTRRPDMWTRTGFRALGEQAAAGCR